MAVEEGLYVKILVWAYQKQESGFTWEDLKNQFNLTEKQLLWAQKVFQSNLPIAENLVGHLSLNDTGGSPYLVLTAKGVSAAVQYLNLKQAENSGKRAERIAWVAIGVGIAVGTIQIVIGLMQLSCGYHG